MKTVGERMKELRKAAGLTQRQLAKEFEISQPQVWRIEKNEDFCISYLMMYVEFFKVSADWMLGYSQKGGM